MSALTDLQGQIEERRKRLARVFEQAGDTYDMSKVTELDGSDSKAKTEQIQALDRELNGPHEAVRGAPGAAAPRREDAARAPQPPQPAPRPRRCRRG
jgi:hypothetical protein